MPRGGLMPIAGYEELLIIPVDRSCCLEGVCDPISPCSIPFVTAVKTTEGDSGAQ